MHFFDKLKVKRETDEQDVHSILAIHNTGDSVKITVKLGGKSLKEISNFARQMGFMMEDLLPILFSYGVSEKAGVDVEKRRSEMFAIVREYSVMRFEAHQIFNDNRALTMMLSTMLAENKRLRRLAEEKGLIPKKKEEWDSWDQEKIDIFFKKYVLVE